MKNFCESLREHTMKIINFEKKETIPVTKKYYKSYLIQTITFAKKSLKVNTFLIKIS